MSDLSWAATKRLVYSRANGCCEYCRTCEYNTGQPMHIEHIDPDGGDDPLNLCLSCSSCNLSKGVVITARDPDTQTDVPLFNPRIEEWHTHFAWIDGGLRLLGKTPTGRATIVRLKMNQQRLVRARNNWITSKSHPPE
jgi:5-methylcytosine-specific restriction endonuclease McrA